MRASIQQLRSRGQASVTLSEAEFRRLVLEHGSYVWRVLRSLGVPHDDLPDVSQETFLIVHRKLASFEARSSLRSWIYGIALRVASDYRKRSKRKWVELPEQLAAAAVQHEQLERTEAWQLLDALLASMDEELRRVFVLFELEQLPMREVAEIVGCPLSTAYWRLNTAREHVQAQLAARRAEEAR